MKLLIVAFTIVMLILGIVLLALTALSRAGEYMEGD